MKRDKHHQKPHSINVNIGGTALYNKNTSPSNGKVANSPDATTVSKQFFAQNALRDEQSTVSSLLQSFGKNAYFSHDLLLGMVTVMSLFFHYAQQSVLYSVSLIIC